MSLPSEELSAWLLSAIATLVAFVAAIVKALPAIRATIEIVRKVPEALGLHQAARDSGAAPLHAQVQRLNDSQIVLTQAVAQLVEDAREQRKATEARFVKLEVAYGRLDCMAAQEPGSPAPETGAGIAGTEPTGVIARQ